ncbi:class E sortase [Kitasatospora sp. NPDC096147]|uniref:class E sortase n=1 Tax=Kitasatospora sp. NPDC096147 TaxID=3364093 RepID=UPI0037F50E12
MSAPVQDRMVKAPLTVRQTPSATAPGPSPVPAPSRGRRPTTQAGWAACGLAALVVGFAGYLPALSELQQQHAQAAAHRTFRDQLANAVAPTGPTADGAPVALITVPALGLTETVVVEGTTGRDLMRGPGHRRDTALPGQPGVSVLFGRRVSFGGPFGRLDELRAGDRIEVTTGLGRAVYTVNAFGDEDHPLTDQAPNRLVLVTGDSDLVPSSTRLVGARLDGDPHPDTGARSALRPTDKALAADRAALPALQLWSLGLLVAVTATTLAVRLWHRWAAYLCAAPILAALVWSCYENAAALLPNLF